MNPSQAPSIPAMALLAADRWSDEEALVDGDVRLTFQELASGMVATTRAAMARGVMPGDRVGIWAPNMWEWIVTALGLLGAGAWLVPINTRFKGDEAAFVLDKADVRMLFTVTGFLGNDYVGMLTDAAPGLPALDDVVVLRGDPPDHSTGWHAFLAEGAAVDVDQAHRRIDDLDRDTVSDVMFTSGTTGRPKGVPLTHGQSLHFFDRWNDVWDLREGDRYLIVNPFFHCFGYKAGWLASLMRGATTLPLAVFEPLTVLDTVQRERVTALPGPPTLFTSILDTPDRSRWDLSSLRIGFVGASSVPAELLRRMRSELPFERVMTGYGLTEASAMVSLSRAADDPEYVAEWNGGAPLPGVEIKVVDDSGMQLPTGHPGELLVRGPNVMTGYYLDPEASARVLEPEGWLHTGDIAVMNERGDFKITDRKKDIYICGGFNVSPAEVEALMTSMPGISQIAIVGMPDRRLDEVGAAFVIPTPGTDLSPDDVVAWAREHMANYKVPRHVEIVDALPLNATGKVLKHELRERAKRYSQDRQSAGGGASHMGEPAAP